MAGIVIKPRARIFHGHDWVYSNEVLKVFGEPQPGEVISLKDGRDRTLGSAIYNPQSQIVARRFSRRRQDLDLEFFIRRLKAAAEVRAQWLDFTDVCRLFWSESDGIPGLIVDRYRAFLVIQTLTLALDQRIPLIVEAIHQVFAPKAIIERNDAPVRKAEGLPLRTGILAGEVPSKIEVELQGLKYELDLLSGQKTGFYLDQVVNYEIVAAQARGRRVLDCFANQGAFALNCARAGAAETTAIEISTDLAESISSNAVRNGLTIQVLAGNVFDLLGELASTNQQYDLIVLDPPSFAKSRGVLDSAWRGYKEIHIRALQMLEPGALLATFSCSHHVDRNMFLEVIVEASVDAKKHLRIVRNLWQSRDHPVLPHIPETEYLKGFLLQVLPGR
ncbi:MAG: class I SAM-dependent rRNA methyltransferase [Verrucomicrobia bacterium]|nr:class I SAM-dependent rRNA methyltransferase [Verrucomicrobiota bacterium]